MFNVWKFYCVSLFVFLHIFLASPAMSIAHNEDGWKWDFDTVTQVRGFDYFSLNGADKISLNQYALERLKARLKTKYTQGLIDRYVDVGDEYWCHGDAVLTELQVNLALIQSYETEMDHTEARKRVDTLLEQVLQSKPTIPDFHDSAPKPEILNGLLEELVEIDQFYAVLVIREYETILSTLNKSGDEIVAFQQLLRPYSCSAFKQLGSIANIILDEYGWPGEAIGPKASHNLWLLFQHQDEHIEWQKKALRHMYTKLQSGHVSKSDYAYLFDRVAVNEGGLQRYGTQLEGCGIKPVEDEERLDERRATMSLPPIAEYLASTINCRGHSSQTQ